MWIAIVLLIIAAIIGIGLVFMPDHSDDGTDEW